jgi:hypothetical protein
MECIVCLEKKESVYNCAASADHVMCQDCEIGWRLTMPLKENGFTITCPMCRTPETSTVRTKKSWYCEIILLEYAIRERNPLYPPDKQKIVHALSLTMSPEFTDSVFIQTKKRLLEKLYPHATRLATRSRIDARRRETRVAREAQLAVVRETAQTMRLNRIQRDAR